MMKWNSFLAGFEDIPQMLHTHERENEFVRENYWVFLIRTKELKDWEEGFEVTDFEFENENQTLPLAGRDKRRRFLTFYR